MVKFITTIPINNPENLHPVVYNNPAQFKLLDSNLTTRFPIIPLMANVAEKDMEITLVVIKIEHANTAKNYDYFLKELYDIEKSVGFKMKLEEVNIPYSELIEDHLDLFGSITDMISDNDKLYLDITYGSKPTPIIYLMAATCGYKYHSDVSIECIIYGAFNFITKESSMYDVTSLFYMNNTINMLDGISDPFNAIKSVLDMGKNNNYDFDEENDEE